MSNDIRIHALRVAEAIGHAIRNDVNKLPKLSREDVQKSIYQSLKNCEKAGIIVEERNDGFKVGDVSILWESWSFKQKMKWHLYNSVPYFKKMGNEIRAEIDSYNELVTKVRDMEKSPTHFPLDLYELENLSYKDYPDHLVVGPKTIVITNVMIKPFKGIDFILMDLEIPKIQDEA